MFNLKLPLRAEDKFDDNNDLSQNSLDSTPRTLLDFNEDSDSSNDNGGQPEDEDDEQLDLETMEAIFDEDTKNVIAEFEQQLDADDEEWLLCNANQDPENMAKELTDREIKKQKKLYQLRRQKFYELGGKKKTRNIMMRYGITHLKLLKEHNTGAGDDYDSVETNPRAVSNSLLRRLRYGEDVVRIEWLREVFQLLAKKQQEDHDKLKFSSSHQNNHDSAHSTTTREAATSITKKVPEPGKEKSISEVDIPLFVIDAPNDGVVDAPNESGVTIAIPVESSTPIAQPSTPTGVSTSGPLTPAQGGKSSKQLDTVDFDANNEADTLAYIRRVKALGAAGKQSVVPTGANGSTLVETLEVRRIPVNAVDENLFVKGMSVFFEQLQVFDKLRRRRENIANRRAEEEKRALLQKKRQRKPGDALDTPDLSVLPSSGTIFKDFDLKRTEEQISKDELFAELRKRLFGPPPPSVQSALSNTTSPRDMSASAISTSQALLDEAQGPASDDDVGGSDQQKQQVGGDFLTRDADVVDAGFRFLFCAVDANDTGSIQWGNLLEYLLDATLLTKAGELDLDSKDYEFVKDHHTLNFNDINDVLMIPQRDLLCVGGVHVTMMSNNYTSNFAERCQIRSPLDTFTLVPQYKVTAMTYMVSLKMLAVASTDSVIRIYSVHSMAKPRQLTQAKIDSNARTLLWFKDILFSGTREGTVCSFVMQYTRGGWELRPHKIILKAHDGMVSRLIAIPTENCICSAALDRTMSMHDAKSLKTVFKFPRDHFQGIIDLCYCDCINGIASISFDGRVLVWMVSLLHSRPISLTDSVRPHVGTLASVACIEHARSLVTLDSKGMLKIWGLKNFLCTQTIACGPYAPPRDAGSKYFRLLVHHCPPSVILPLGSTQLFLFSRRRLFVFEYNLSQRSVILRNTADDDGIISFGYSYVEQLYITFSSKSVRIWEANSSLVRDTFRCSIVDEAGGISAAIVHPNGRAFFLGTHKGIILSKNFSTGATLFMARCHASACLGLRFCYAALVPSRSSSSHATEILADGSTAPAPQQVATKAGLGDILITIADDSIFALTVDFKTKLGLEGVENARCVDHDAQSSLILIGDSCGSICIFLQVNISGQRNLPYQVLQFPKRLPREITMLTVLQGLSAFVAADDEGTLGLFSLKHHPKPFQCIGVWSNVADSKNSSSSVTSMTFFHSKWLLYCGDELGSVVVYQIKDAFLSSQRSSGIEGAKDPRDVAMSPKSGRLNSGSRRQNGALGSSRVGGTPRTFNHTSPRTILERKRSAMVVDHGVSDHIDFRAIGALVVLINRFQPHLEAVTCIIVVSPDNLGEQSEETKSLNDAGVNHTVLMTSSVDQCCYSWKLAGTVHLGALEQYGRCRIPITSAAQADDLKVIATKRELHQMDAKRDAIRLRSRGLMRKANTHTMSTIPQRFIPAPPQALVANSEGNTGRPSATPGASYLSTQPGVGSYSFPLSARSDHTSNSVTPRTSRMQKILSSLGGGGEITLHPDVPSRALMGLQEYAKFLTRRKKTLRSASLNPVAMKAGIDAINAAAAAQKQQDPETLSQLLSSDPGDESDLNSVLDELFYIPAAQETTAARRSSAVKYQASLAGSDSCHSVSTTATSIVNRIKNLTVALQSQLQPSSRMIGDLEVTAPPTGSVLPFPPSSYSVCGGTTTPRLNGSASSREGSPSRRSAPFSPTLQLEKQLQVTNNMMSEQAKDRQLVRESINMEKKKMERNGFGSSSGKSNRKSSNFDFGVFEESVAMERGHRPTEVFADESSESDDSTARQSQGPMTPHSIISKNGSNTGGHRAQQQRRRNGAILKQHTTDDSYQKGGLSARSGTSASSRRVIVQEAYIVPSRTLRSAQAGKKDARLGYHRGTLEAYRTLAASQMPNGGKLSTMSQDEMCISPSVPCITIENDACGVGVDMDENGSGEEKKKKAIHDILEEKKEAFLQSLADRQHQLSARGRSPRTTSNECSTTTHPSDHEKELRSILSSSAPLTREALENILPATSLRERLIQTLVLYGPTIRKHLFVEFSSKNQSQLLKQVTFENKRLKDIAHDSIVLQHVPKNMRRPSTAPLLCHEKSDLEATDELAVAEKRIEEQWELYWNSFKTTMNPPPPEIFDKSRQIKFDKRKPPVPVQQRRRPASSCAFASQIIEDRTPLTIAQVSDTLRIEDVEDGFKASSTIQVVHNGQQRPVATSSGLHRLLRNRVANIVTSNQAVGHHRLSQEQQSEIQKLVKCREAIMSVDRVEVFDCAVQVALPKLPVRASSALSRMRKPNPKGK